MILLDKTKEESWTGIVDTEIQKTRDLAPIIRGLDEHGKSVDDFDRLQGAVENEALRAMMTEVSKAGLHEVLAADEDGWCVDKTDIKDLEMSCFDGHYVTGGIDEAYFEWLEANCSS